MKCPRCAADDDRVVDSRTTSDGAVIRRRRECLVCFMRFTTYERFEESPLRVIKKNGDRVRFDRERIQHGILRACEKLPVAMADVEDAVQRIETRCQGEYDREVPSSVIGSLVMEELKGLHQVAFGRTIGDRAADYDGDGKYDFVVSDHRWGDGAGATGTAGRVYLSFGQY